MKSYIGISGFVSRAEVQAALDVFPDCGRQLMVGVLASKKTFGGYPVRLHRRHPEPHEIQSIFVDDARCLNLIHYASDEPPDSITQGLFMLRGGPHCHGVQFNVTWPTPERAAVLREHNPIWRIVLQCRSWDSPEALSALEARIAPYRRLVTDILLDASGGAGEPLSVTWVGVAVEYMRRSFPGMGIGIAGGLCAETIPSIADHIRDGVSIDAEGRLRDESDGGGRLDLFKVRAYLQAVAKECV